MIDREKVIKGLTACNKTNCECCPYNEAKKINSENPICFINEMLSDALALLKEHQEQIRQLRLALDIAKGTCNGIKVEGR